MGHGWTHGFSARLSPETINNIPHLRVVDPTGRGAYFKQGTGNRWDGALKEKSYVLLENQEYIWHRLDGSKYAFNAQGQLIWQEDAAGNRQTLAYNPTTSLLETVTDAASGRALTFHYRLDGLLDFITGPLPNSATPPDSTLVQYGYDAHQNLIFATYADGSSFRYEYNDPNNLHNLTAKKDAAGKVLSTWQYDAQGRAFANFTRDGRGASINYVNDTTVAVTDAYGNTNTYTIQKFDRHFPKVTNITGPGGCPSCAGEKPVRYAYDAALNTTEEEYANGTINRYQNHDARGNPGTVTLAAGTTEARTITTTWHPRLDQPLTRSEASVLGTGNKVTVWDYDDDGNATANENPTNLVHRKIEQGFTRDAAGAVVPYEYITTYQYNARGQITGVDGPLPGTQDRAELTYNAVTGDLESLTLPGAGTTLYGNHDAAGLPRLITDPNGNPTILTYDARGRVTSAKRDGVGDTWTYNTAGDIATFTGRSGYQLTYSYDATYGRLEGVTDNVGNSIHYTYDLAGIGKLKAEETFAPAGTLRKKLEYSHEDPVVRGRLYKLIHPDASEIVFGRDPLGNIQAVTEPVEHAVEPGASATTTTTYARDALSRLTATTEPGNVVTRETYDRHDNPATVTDANGHATTYQYDDFGRVLSVTSPDSGLTTFFHDLAANTVTRTDAAGVATIFTSDGLGRLVAVSYPDASQNLSLAYDQGTNGKGRLYQVTDQSGTTTYSYDAWGQVTSTTKAVPGAAAFTTALGYNAATAALETFTSPTGLVLTYQRDATGKITGILANGQPFLSNITWLPFGGVEDFTFGSGIRVDRSFNQLYQMTDLTAGSLGLHYTHWYEGGSVKDVTGKPAPGPLTGLTDLAYQTGTNRIDQVSSLLPPARQYTHDANGNTTGDGVFTYEYDQENRLTTVKRDGAVVAGYRYDAMNRRVSKTVGGATTLFHYDHENNLIAETQADGTPMVDYIYLDGQPVGLKRHGDQAGIYYIVNDHLGTPQRVLNSAGATVWEAAYLPFGEAQVQVGTITFNLRFPGQYYDAETGRHYNWHRFYDPRTGRYMTPDPIGLEGGINLYGYANQNPVNYIDPDGQIAFLPLLAAAWAVAEAGLSIYDVVDTAKTLSDPCASRYEKGAAVTGLALGMVAPGGLYGKAAKWTLGGGKSATKWANQMKKRGWTEQQISEALQGSKGIPTRNAVNPGNPATRHIHPETGKSVVIDTKRGEIIHVGGEGFDYSDWDL